MGKEGREIDWLPGGHCTQCAAERRSDRPAVKHITSRGSPQVQGRDRWQVVHALSLHARCISEGLESLQRRREAITAITAYHGVIGSEGVCKAHTQGKGKERRRAALHIPVGLARGYMSLTGAWYSVLYDFPIFQLSAEGNLSTRSELGIHGGPPYELLERPMEPITVRDGPIAYGSNTIGRSVVHGLAERVRTGLLNACPFRQIAPGSVLGVGYRVQTYSRVLRSYARHDDDR